MLTVPVVSVSPYPVTTVSNRSSAHAADDLDWHGGGTGHRKRNDDKSNEAKSG